MLIIPLISVMTIQHGKMVCTTLQDVYSKNSFL